MARSGYQAGPTAPDRSRERGAWLDRRTAPDHVAPTSKPCARADAFAAPVLPDDDADRILTAHLIQAAYALQDGNDEVAHAALLRALDQGRLMVFAAPPLFTPEDLAGINIARERLYRPLMEWVIAAARARGHVLTAGLLSDVLVAMEAYDPALAESLEEDEPGDGDAESAAEMLGAELRALETLASELAAWEVPDPPQQPQLV